MGLMASWVAVKGASRDEVLAAMGFELASPEAWVEPGCAVADYSVHELSTGWTVLFAEDFDWADRARVIEASKLGEAVGLQFEDKVQMTCVAVGARDGVEVWRVHHDNDGEPLAETGVPPDAYQAIRDRLVIEQLADDSVDYLHEIGHELGEAVCGYRVDTYAPLFQAVRPTRQQEREPEFEPRKPRRKGKGLFGWLFGRPTEG